MYRRANNFNRISPYSTQHIDHMKTSFFLTAFCLISLSAFLLYSKFEINNNDISISISNTDDTYQFNASFNKGNTIKVLRYINKALQSGGSLKRDNAYFDESTSSIDGTTTLADKSTFYIKESPGSLKIEFDKRKNSGASLIRIKNMCDGIKNVLAGK